MPAIGPLEILAIAVIALIVFGPEKLPDIARTVARTLGELRRMATDMKTEFQAGLDIEDDQEAHTENGKVAEHPVARALKSDKELTKRADEKLSPSPTEEPAPQEISSQPDAGSSGPGSPGGPGGPGGPSAATTEES